MALECKDENGSVLDLSDKLIRDMRERQTDRKVDKETERVRKLKTKLKTTLCYSRGEIHTPQKRRQGPRFKVSSEGLSPENDNCYGHPSKY